MAIVKVDAFKCNKCGHVWVSGKYDLENRPVTCSKCKSPYWDR